MNKPVVCCSAATLEDLTKLFNERHYSTNWIPHDDNGTFRFFNTKLGKFAAGFIVEKKGRYQYKTVLSSR